MPASPSKRRRAVTFSAVVLAAPLATALILAAPPTDLTEPDTIVGTLVEVGDNVLVLKADDEEGEPRDIRIGLRETTTLEINDERAEWGELQPGDTIRVLPHEDAMGVAQSVSVARVQSHSDDADEQALRNRVEDAREGDVHDRRRRLDRNDGEHVLTRGNVYVVELPAASAAARAGFRPGDVVIFAAEGARDADLLRGLTVQRTRLGASFVIDAAPVDDAGDDVDVDVRVRDRNEVRLDRDDTDVRIEIDRD